MIMKVAICDDNKEFVLILEKYLEDMDVTDIDCEVFYDGEALVDTYKRGSADYDVVFLDMEMDRLNGIDAANMIRKMDENVLIVFVTSHRKYVYKSFECSPFRFIVKPVSFEEFKDVFEKICIKLNDKPQYIVFYEKKEKIRLSCSDIIYFSCKTHDIIIHKKDGHTHKMRKSIGKLMEDLDDSKFVQVHRSYIINLEHVYKVGNNYVTMHHTDKLIPISDTYKDELNFKFLNCKERKFILL